MTQHEDYVTYEQAVKLMELGFDLPCWEFYTKDVKFPCVEVKPLIKPKDWNNILIGGQHKFSAPTLAQVLKWLRDEWNLHIDACVFGDYSEDADGKVADEWTFWAFDIYSTESGKQIVDDDEEYDNYEAAISAGITAALGLLATKTSKE